MLSFETKQIHENNLYLNNNGEIIKRKQEEMYEISNFRYLTEEELFQQYDGNTFSCQFNWQFNFTPNIFFIRKYLNNFPTYKNFFKKFYKNTIYNFYNKDDRCPICNKHFYQFKHKGKKVHRYCGVIVRINYGELFYFEYPIKDKCSCLKNKLLMCIC